jgi:hypothetical protein
MSYQNISYVVSEDDATNIRNAIASLHTFMPFLVNLTADERQRVLKHGDTDTEFTDDAIFATRQYIQIFPPSFVIPEYHKDYDLHFFLDEVLLNLLSITEKVTNTKMAVGGELKRASNRVYEIVGMEKDNYPGLQALYQKMSARYKKNGPKKEKNNAKKGKNSTPS